MSQLQDLSLLTKPLDECTDEELEERIKVLTNMRLSDDKPKKKTVKSNSTKRKEDLLNGLSDDDLAGLMQELLGR